ncbi:MAG: deaminase [Caulobacteraceae bacterium]|nr:deaminase [Caulobacteraceae bacterium]
MRAEHDAVLIGIETALADDPRLTVRIGRDAHEGPLRVVLDSRQRLPLDMQLVATARKRRTMVLTTTEPSAELQAAGVEVYQLPASEGRVELRAALSLLEQQGVNTLLVEGGGQVAASFIRENLVDRLEWFRAPIVLGSEGRPAIGGLSYEYLDEFPCFKRVELISIGQDAWERYQRA